MDEHAAPAMRRSLDPARAALPFAAGWPGQEAPRRRPRQPLSAVLAALSRAKTTEVLARDELHLPPGSHLHEGVQGGHDYRIFLPSPGQSLRGLVMMLHGCTQTALDFALGTRMHLHAERNGWIVLYPEQGSGNNSARCWNWFRPQDQARDGGEPEILAGLADSVARDHGLPARSCFVAGLSAGGAMAAILGQTHPDVFRAVGIHSGLAPNSARDLVSAFAAMRGDPLPSAEAVRLPSIIFHGSEDTTVAPRNAGHLAGHLRDIRKQSGKRKSRRYDLVSGTNRAGHRVELWRIAGAGHAWSGGSPKGSFTDPAGPDASAEMARFFKSLA